MRFVLFEKWEVVTQLLSASDSGHTRTTKLSDYVDEAVAIR